jgi:hypothetical protein
VLPAEGAELGNELQRSLAKTHSHARELWKAHAQVVAVWHDDVTQRLELIAKGGQLGNEKR